MIPAVLLGRMKGSWEKREGILRELVKVPLF